MTKIDRLLNKLKNPSEELELIRTGIHPIFIETFLKQHDLALEDVLQRLSISRSTYFAKKKNHKTLDAYSTEKFIRLISVLLKAAKVLGKAEAKNWMYRNIPSLGNEVPINLLDTEAGHRLVTQALLHIQYGIYD